MAFRKSCDLCEDDVEQLDYKDADRLDRFLTDRGKILPRRATGACSRHQKQVATAVKRARYLALIPYIKNYHR
jgi:small subunit ribosomal protein S18